MSTRSATIIRQTTYWGDMEEHAELMRFYRHCDGYPEGHGIDLASSVMAADEQGWDDEDWLQGVLADFLNLKCSVEFEPHGCEHGDIEFLYLVEGIVDRRWGKTKSGKLPVTISVYQHAWDAPYIATELNTQPIFSGTAYEYAEKFGKEQ